MSDCPTDLPFMPTNPSLTRSVALKLWPDADPALLDPLALVWDEVVHRILTAMLRMDPDPQPLHIHLRAEMVYELARLQVWLGKRVVERRLSGRNPKLLDPVRERLECLGHEGEGIIAGTARMAYEHVWSRRVEERWKPKSLKAAERELDQRQATLPVKPVSKNHFIPRWFVRDHWAVDGKIQRWQRDQAGWSPLPRSVGDWGFKHGLYSDSLEAYFCLMEGDAKRPIEMLLTTIPLNDPQRLSLVGFLVIQLLRNPFFMERLRSNLEPKIAELGYGDEDSDTPRKAYESLYRNNDFYHQLAHPILWSQWAVVKADTPFFVLPDTFAACTDFGDGPRLIVPLTASACFVTLPARECEKRIVPLHLPAEDALARRIASALIRAANREFLSHPDFRIDDILEETAGDVLNAIAATIERRLEDPS